MTDAATRQREIAAITELQLDMMRRTKAGQRGQHPKMTGFVWGTFEVLADITAQYRVGLFAQPGQYTAYIRFSNGAAADDDKRDVHGMAIKVTGVPGRKVLDDESDASTQDFILADNPIFFIRNRGEFGRFMADFEVASRRGRPPLRFLAWLALHRPRDLRGLLTFRRPALHSPLVTQYWSQVPYAFGLGGATICRYAAVPRPNPAWHGGGHGADRHRDNMVAQLATARQAAHFDFTVQLHADATEAVIDNPTVRWNTREQTVATISIPPQDFRVPAQERFGDALSFTPWHALPEHRPMGQINEIRRAVYRASSEFRHGQGQVRRAEPRGDEHRSF